MKFNLFFIILVCFLLTSCEKSSKNSPPAPESVLGFDELQVGDKIYYELFLAEDYFDDSNLNYEFTADTLVLEVLEIDNNGRIIISERLTENSASFSSDERYYFEADSIYSNHWLIQNDSLLLEPHSSENVKNHLFAGKSPGFNLQNFNENQTEISGWKIDESAGEFSGKYFVTNGEIGNHIFGHINVSVHNEAMAVDGPGHMFFYNQDNGILRTATYSAWTGAGRGWERIVQ